MNLSVVFLLFLLAATSTRTGGATLRSCGRKILLLLSRVCPQGCTEEADRSLDIGTTACYNAVTDEYIIRACCPKD